jgi:hypothetical protein
MFSGAVVFQQGEVMYGRFWLIPKILVLATKITEQASWTRVFYGNLKYFRGCFLDGVDFSGAKVHAVIKEIKG